MSSAAGRTSRRIALFAGAAVLAGAPSALGAGATVAIGDIGTPASRIVADGNALALTAQGYTVTRTGYADPFTADAALRAGEVDLYVTDTSTLLRRVLSRPVERRPTRLHAALTAPLAARGQAVVAFSPADDAPNVVCSRAAMKRFGIGRLDRLGRVSKNVVLGVTAPHVIRADGLVALRAQFRRVVVANGDARFTLLRRGRVHCVMATGAEPRVAGAAFLALKDPTRRLAGTPARPVTVGSAAYLATAPASLAPTLTAVGARYTTDQLRSARARVEVNNQPSVDVARVTLQTAGLLP